MAGPEGAVLAAPIAAVGAEGGLGAAASAVGKIEVGAAIPTPEIGKIGNLSAEAGLATKLDTTLGTPDIGIKQVADVKVSDFAPGIEKPSSSARPAAEAPVEASESSTPPITGVENGTGPVAKREEKAKGVQGETAGEADKDTTLADKSKAATEGEKPTDGKQIGEQKSQTETKDNQPASDKKDAKPPEDADKAKRTQELEGKVKDKTATADELKELRGLKQDPEQRRKDLEQRALDGTITDQEAQELGDLNNTEGSKNLTPEQQMEKLQKDIDELGTELMRKIANGEEVTKEDLEKLRNLRGQESLINKGFTLDQARAAMREAERRGGRRNERQEQAAKDIADKIRELMALELQLLSIPKNVEALRAQKKQAQDEAQAKHREAESATSPDQRLQKKSEEYNSYMKIANIIGAIVAQKHMVPVLEARRQDLEQHVRRKLGVSHGFGALMEWGAAKTRNVATQVGVGAAEEMDYRTGNY